MVTKKDSNPPNTPDKLQNSITTRLIIITRLIAMNSKCCTRLPKTGTMLLRQYNSPMKRIAETATRKFLLVEGVRKTAINKSK